MSTNIIYSDTYSDEKYEYRHAILPDDLTDRAFRFFRKRQYMTESQWRNIGVRQTKGWEHFLWHSPEPHILIFRRPITNNDDEPFNIDSDDDREPETEDGEEPDNGEQKQMDESDSD